MNIAIASSFRIICILYILKKLLPKHKPQRENIYILYLVLISFFILSFCMQKYFSSLFTISFIIIFSIYILYFYKTKFDYAFVLAAISYSIYYLIYNISSLLIALSLSSFYKQNKSIPFTLAIFFTNALTYIFIILFFRIKRFKSGLLVFTNTTFINTVAIISFFVLSIKTIRYTYTGENQQVNNVIYGIPISLLLFLLALLLYLWWRKQITKSYIEKLQQLEIQSLYDELSEKEKLIQKLTDDNTSLARIIHKDNKLIPAMEHAVLDYLSVVPADMTDITTYGKQLADSLRDMAKDRKGILETYQNENIYLHQTGYVSIDAVLAYMQKKADANHISIECRFTKETINYVLEYISKEDLSHLLSDLLENALIAMRSHESGKLLVVFGKFHKEAYISVADSGIPFDIETLHTFGIQPHTTHSDSGGSGIGLMDIWKLKKKYRASIQIQEYENHKDHFTKKITISLNRKNHYVIQSYRHMAIMNTQTRGDLYVIPSDNNTENGGKSV